MTIKFNVTGTERKALVKAIADFTGEKAKYKFMPTCAYDIGTLLVDKEGALHIPDGTDATQLLEHLATQGFAAEIEEGIEAMPEPQPEADTAPVDGLEISMPTDGFTDASIANLKKLVASKASLIKQAVGASDLPIVVTDTKVTFPWFSGQPQPDEAQAYMQLIISLCEMAKNQKRVTAKETTTDNPKYTFRCFLLRLGFIGDEYKQHRKILLRNFSGSSAFKSGHPSKKEVATDEISE